LNKREGDEKSLSHFLRKGQFKVEKDLIGAGFTMNMAINDKNLSISNRYPPSHQHTEQGRFIKRLSCLQSPEIDPAVPLIWAYVHAASEFTIAG
jgi:hypothetical protein